jgi:hypothetical protein
LSETLNALRSRNFRPLFAARPISFFESGLVPMAFLAAGYAVADGVANAIRTSASLWIGAAWLAVAVPTFRDLRRFGAGTPTSAARVPAA